MRLTPSEKLRYLLRPLISAFRRPSPLFWKLSLNTTLHISFLNTWNKNNFCHKIIITTFFDRLLLIRLGPSHSLVLNLMQLLGITVSVFRMKKPRSNELRDCPSHWWLVEKLYWNLGPCSPEIHLPSTPYTLFLWSEHSLKTLLIHSTTIFWSYFGYRTLRMCVWVGRHWVPPQADTGFSIRLNYHFTCVLVWKCEWCFFTMRINGMRKYS